MFPRTFLRIVGVGWLLGGAAFASAQPATSGTKATVDVRAVRFALVAPSGGNARWLEAEAELDVRVLGGRTPFVDRVHVLLQLGTRTLGGGYQFYRSEYEAVTLETGPARFRFYLPPEVVKRDGLGGEPEFWTVKVTAAGETQPEGARHASAALRETERRRSFEAKIAAEAPVNDGVLQAQHFTPFALQHPQATPTPVRRAR